MKRNRLLGLFAAVVALALFFGGLQPAQATVMDLGFGTDGQNGAGWGPTNPYYYGVAGYDGGPAGVVSGAANDYYDVVNQPGGNPSSYTFSATGSAALGSDKLVAGTYSISLYGIALADAPGGDGPYWSPPNPANVYMTINALSAEGQALLGTSSTLMLRTANVNDEPAGVNAWDYYNGLLTFTVPANSPAIGDYLELQFTGSGNPGVSSSYGGASWVAFTDISATVTAIPEPGSLMSLLAFGCCAALAHVWRRRRT